MPGTASETRPGPSFLRGDAGLDDEDSPRMSSSSRAVGMVAVCGGTGVESGRRGWGEEKMKTPHPNPLPGVPGRGDKIARTIGRPVLGVRRVLVEVFFARRFKIFGAA
jgi:hypothetical protein